MSFRDEARQHLVTAKALISENTDQKLIYAALELRMAIEAISYDRANAIKDDFPPSEYETWKPSKVISVLLDIDPNADQPSELSFGEEPSPGERPSVMHSLGSDRPLTIREIKEHYDALGSYLHSQTIGQRKKSAKRDLSSLKKRCKKIVGVLDESLSAPINSFVFGVYFEFNCLRCEKRIRRRFKMNSDSAEATCWECKANHRVRSTGERQVAIEPVQSQVPCANADCKEDFFLWADEIVPGTNWNCLACGNRNRIILSVRAERPDANE